MKGLIFNIQRFSTEDGPGIRTTVFFKGCPLNCPWCHNPEGIDSQSTLVWYDARCIGARECVEVCPVSALSLTARGIVINRNICTVCGECIAVCPTGALELTGKWITRENLLKEIERDKIFYTLSEGGVTFSGGEPMLQADFLVEIAQMCRSAGIHVALDTSGAVRWEKYVEILPWVDLVLYDLKIFNSARHHTAIGVENEMILENARRLQESGIPFWIRTPVIPGFTSDLSNLLEIADFIRKYLPRVKKWELLAYTNLGQPKYQRLGKHYGLSDCSLLSRAQMENLSTALSPLVPQVTWSGITTYP
ncbi:MAG TPA: glycyl-radical enzyme activating protein [Anaerolineaceae bacterium]